MYKKKYDLSAGDKKIQRLVLIYTDIHAFSFPYKLNSILILSNRSAVPNIFVSRILC